MNIFLPPLRPPGARKETEFLQLCVRCGKCIEVCPHNILKLAGGFSKRRHTPYFDAETGPCQLCMKCPPVCPTGALDNLCLEMGAARIGSAYILTSGCHNYNNGVMCWTCYDRCPLRGQAIILKDGLTPQITDKCVGCGICAHVCPQKSITIVSKNSSYIPLDAAPTAS